jgi:hypothetical protein
MLDAEARSAVHSITAYGRFQADVSAKLADLHIGQVNNLEETIDSDM